jgi:uncharacterized RDD family membrane protein YckC
MWYYAKDRAQVGPVNEEALDYLLATGVISDDTLVRREGIAEWQPLKIARPQSPPTLPADAQPQEVQNPEQSGAVIVYAGFRIRFVARILDVAIMNIVEVSLAIAVGVNFLEMEPLEFLAGKYPFASLLGIIVEPLYSIYFVGKYGATPAKMALGLRIVRPDKSSISYGRATGRYFAGILSGIVLCIGYIMVAFDDEKRGLHDRICDTRVVKVN